jgi:hypothetical protein
MKAMLTETLQYSPPFTATSKQKAGSVSVRMLSRIVWVEEGEYAKSRNGQTNCAAADMRKKYRSLVVLWVAIEAVRVGIVHLSRIKTVFVIVARESREVYPINSEVLEVQLIPLRDFFAMMLLVSNMIRG